MRTWFTSLEGAVTLSAIAFMALMARSMGLDAMFVMPLDMGFTPDQPGMVALFMLWTVVLFGGWLWALLAAARGGRKGLIATFIFSLVSGLLGILTLVVFCGGTGCAVPPVGNIVVWIELVTGLVASASLGLQLRGIGRSRTDVPARA